MHVQGGPKKNNTENISNIHNKLNTFISSKCKSLSTVIGTNTVYLSAVINYLFNVHTGT